MQIDESGKSTTISLPFDTLVQIFKFLDTTSKGKAAQVCTLWRKTVNCKSVWKSVEIRLRSEYLDKISECSISKRGIQRFSVSNFEPNINGFLRRVPDLEYLKFTCCCVNENMLKLFKTVPNSAEILKLASEVLVHSSGIPDQILEYVARRFPSFHKLNPHYCYFYSDHMLEILTRGMKKLKVLQLDGCVNLVHALGAQMIQIAGENTKNVDQLISLQELNLRNVLHFKERTFAYISQKFVNLVSLKIECCRWDTDEGLAYLLQLKNLEILSFAFSSGITDRGLNYISQLINLKSLDLSNCNQITDSGFALISRLINLKNLSLCDCSQLRDSTLKYLNELPHLLELELQMCNISDAGLSHLADGNLKLTLLDMSGCSDIGDQGLLYICQSSFALRKLSVSCSKVTDYGIIHIVEKFPCLQVLKLRSCHFVTSECKKLIVEMQLHKNKNFKLCTTDDSFEAFQMRLYKLFSSLESLANSIV